MNAPASPQVQVHTAHVNATTEDAQAIALDRAFCSWKREHPKPTPIFGTDFVSARLGLMRPEFLARIFVVEESTAP